MKKLYLVNGVEVAGKPSNGEVYERLIIIEDHVLERNTYQASTQAERDEQKRLGELQWRNSQLDMIDAKSYKDTHPYIDLINTYMQELRDYPDSPLFPYERPPEPVNENGVKVIN